MKILYALFLLCLLALTGCMFLPVEEEIIRTPIARIPEARTLRTHIVTQGDVRLTTNLSVFYVPAREERLVFPIAGLRILSTYVSVGDSVQAGDIVASLDRPDIRQRLHAVHWEEAWARLHLSHARIRYATALRISEITGEPTDISLYTDEINVRIRQLEIIEMQRNYLERENEMHFLRSPIDGTVTTVLSFTEGTLSDTRQTVVTVTDQTLSVFMARGQAAELILPGDRLTIIIQQEPFLAEVVDPDAFGIVRADGDRFLIIIDDIQPTAAALGHAFLPITLDEALDALYIPAAALHRAGERTFVYVLADGVRSLRDVEIGLVGNNTIQIISGLEEGELVII